VCEQTSIRFNLAFVSCSRVNADFRGLLELLFAPSFVGVAELLFAPTFVGSVLLIDVAPRLEGLVTGVLSVVFAGFVGLVAGVLDVLLVGARCMGTALFLGELVVLLGVLLDVMFVVLVGDACFEALVLLVGVPPRLEGLVSGMLSVVLAALVGLVAGVLDVLLVGDRCMVTALLGVLLVLLGVLLDVVFALLV
jgi:hypothetical protein